MAKATLGALMEPVETAAGLTASAPRPKPKGGRVSRFEVELADNGGLIATTYFHPNRSNGRGPDDYVKPLKTVHASKKDLLVAISKMF